MELGNLIFGNSRGIYAIEKRKEFEAILLPLLEMAGLSERGYSNYGSVDDTCATFDNDIFTIRPYYWGDDDIYCQLPNFIYKPTGFSIDWYKYPLRDSYMNQDISLEEFEDIINKCKKSLLK